jgi:hypothetical protein
VIGDASLVSRDEDEFALAERDRATCGAPTLDVLAGEARPQRERDGCGHLVSIRRCLAAAPGPMVFELHDVRIEVDGALAFSHFLSRCGVIEKDNVEKTSWFRGTQCYRRTADGWEIVHEHFSLPFDMETGAMLFDATP